MKLFALSRIREGVDPEQVRSHIVVEAQLVWSLYKSGPLREIYHRSDQPGFVLVFEADTAEVVDGIIAALPMVQSGFLTFDLIPVEVPLPLGSQFAA